MRERLALLVSGLALTTLVALAALFARGQNPRAEQTTGAVLASVSPAVDELAAENTYTAVATPPSATEVPSQQVADSTRGQVVFEEQCTGCHSAAGVGSPRLPLDGVGGRRSRAQLRAWMIGDAALADSLGLATLRRKQAYAELPSADLEALLSFLESLETPR